MHKQIKNADRHYQQVGNILISRISSGEFIVGQRLPAERLLSEELGVSRAIVREAIIMLELLGLVEVKKGSGIYICSTPEDEAKKSTNNEPKIYGKEEVGPFEMLQARQVIESSIAGMAATQLTKKDLLNLKRALDVERLGYENEDDNPYGDRLFHRYIAEATQNSVFVDIIDGMWEWRETSSMWKKLHQRIDEDKLRLKWLKDHEEIFTKLKQRDAKGASDAMWQHIENVKLTLMELSDIDDPEFDGFLFAQPSPL